MTDKPQKSQGSVLVSVAANWLGLVAVGVISVLLTPFLIHRLGNFYYGMWILAANALDYCGLLEMGMRWTLFRFVARFKGAEERAGLDETLTNGLAVTTVVTVALTGVIFLLVLVLPGFFGLTGAPRHIFRYVLALLGVSVAVGFPSQLLAAYIRGLQRFDLYNFGLILGAILRAILLVLVLSWGWGVVAVAGVTLGVSVFSVLLNWVLLRIADRHVSVGLHNLNWGRAKELVSFGFYSFLSNAGEYLRFYSDSLVIGRVLGLALITPFSIATRLIEYLKLVMGGVNGPLMVEMSDLAGKNRRRELQDAFLRGTRITTLLTFFFCSLLLLDGKALIRAWVGQDFVASYVLLVVLLAGYVVNYSQHPCLLLIFARGRFHRALSWWTLAEGVANVALSFHWAKQYGLFGVALGTTLPLLVTKTIVQPWYGLRVAELSLKDYFVKALARPLAVFALSYAICQAGLAARELGPNLLGLVWTVCWQAAVFGLFTYLFGLVSSERQILRQRTRQFAISLRLIRA